MNHRFLRVTAILGILVLGIVLMVAPAQASNMGFKLERTLQWQNNYFNYFYVSIPFFRSFTDWDTSGTVTSDDALIDWFVKSHPAGTDLLTLGSMTIVGFDNEPGGDIALDNAFYGRQIVPTGTDTYIIVGNVPDPGFPIDEVSTPGWRGYQIQLAGDATNPPSHPIVIVGSHNPAVTEATMPNVANFFNFYMVSIPYHTTWTLSDDVLCAAWAATTGGDCHTAPNDPNLSITIVSFDNEPGGAIGLDNQFYGRQIIWAGADTMIVGNVPDPGFPITPGEGYEFQLVGTAGTDVMLPFPHY